MKTNDKTPFKDMSAANDNFLRPWARNPETDVKLDRAINGLNNILQMSAPQKFSGKQGYSSLDRTPDRIIALYEFARSHPDWVDGFLDGLPVDAADRPADQVLTAMENTMCDDNYFYDSDESSQQDDEYDEEENEAAYGESILGDVDVLEAAFGLSDTAEMLGPEFEDPLTRKKYLSNGNPRFEKDALRRHSCYDKTTRLNKIQKKKEDRKLASVRFKGRYRLANSALSLMPPQKQAKRRRKGWKKKSYSETNILTINEPEPDVTNEQELVRPMTAEEFYDTRLDLLQDNPEGETMPLREATPLLRPSTSYLQCGLGGTIPPSPLHREPTISRRPVRTPEGTLRPATADLPLLRPMTTDKSSINQLRETKILSGSSEADPPHRSHSQQHLQRPATSSTKRTPPLSLSTPTGSSRFDKASQVGDISGLAVNARPQSMGRKVPSNSFQKLARTTYADTSEQFLDSGSSVQKFVPFVHREMSKLRSIRDQMRTMEGRMLAFSGNLNAILDDPDDQYAQSKNTGISPGGVAFTKKTLFPIDAQRKMTERVYKEAKEKAAVDSVRPRMKADGYDKAVPIERMYQSETKRFIANNEAYDKMRSTMSRTFHIKQGELQEYAEEAQRLGKRPFEVGPGGMKC